MYSRLIGVPRRALEYLIEISFYNIYSAFVKGFNIQNRGPCVQLKQSLQELEANMTWAKALVYVSSFSYLGGVVVSRAQPRFGRYGIMCRNKNDS
jgi:hypothetical protein